jgi:hypothetical protein
MTKAKARARAPMIMTTRATARAKTASLRKKNQFTRNHETLITKIKVMCDMRVWSEMNKQKLYDALDPKFRKSIEKDHENRATALVEYVLKHDLNEIALMDGDGRMVSQIIDEYFEKKGSTLKITVVEIDKEAHEYHKRVLPAEVYTVHGDILNRVPSRGCMLYLNFCSIGEIVNKMTSDVFISEIRKHKHVMIGYTVEGTKKARSITGKKREKTELAKTMSFIEKNYKLVSKRGGFYKTFITRD